MMKYFKKSLPHLVALVIFMAISALFFAPQFQGKALRQGDMVQVSGMITDINDHVEKYDEHPQWAGNMFSGMPAYLINMNYDGRWVKQITDNAYFLGQPAAFLFVAMAGFYLMLLMFGVNPWLSIIGGVAYGLSSYFPIIIHAGHITKMMALCWVAPLIGSIYYSYRKNRYLGALLAGIFASIEISTSHPQITYYFLFVIVGLVIVELVRAYKEKLMRSFGMTTLTLLGAAILALGSNLVQLYYVGVYTTDSTRGPSELTATASNNATSGLDKDYATAWSYGLGESFNMFIPNFVGGSSHGGFATDGAVAQSLKPYNAEHIATQLPAYWGSQSFTSGPVYLGAVMVFLFIFGLFVVKGAVRWWIVGVSSLALMLAWGHNMMWLTDLFLDYFPLYNKFRTVAMILVILEWSVPMLGIVALDRMVRGEISEHSLMRGLKGALAITGGFAILTAFVLPTLVEFSSIGDSSYGLPQEVVRAMEVERSSLLRMDALRSLLFVILTAGAIWAYSKKWIKVIPMAAVMALLVTIDLYSVDRRYVKLDDFTPTKQAMAMPMTEANKQILKDESNYRVVNFTVDPFRDASTSYYHRSVGGYHAAKLRRYQDLIDYHLSKQNMAVYDMLNTKYFITKDGVTQNPTAAGNGWFVQSVKFVDNPNQEIQALGTPGWDPQREAFVDVRFRAQIEPVVAALDSDSSSTVTLTSYRVNHLTYQTQSRDEGVAVFSEIYYDKGWKAYIDGKETPYFRADYVLRGLVVPEGNHTVEWKFAAPHFGLIVAITRASSLILLLGALGMIVFSAMKIRRKRVN